MSCPFCGVTPSFGTLLAGAFTAHTIPNDLRGKGFCESCSQTLKTAAEHRAQQHHLTFEECLTVYVDAIEDAFLEADAAILAKLQADEEEEPESPEEEKPADPARVKPDPPSLRHVEKGGPGKFSSTHDKESPDAERA